MTKNVGEQEKAIRLLAGGVFLAAGILPRRLLGLAGLVLLWTASTRYCPMNEALGINRAEQPEGESGETPAVSQPQPAAVG
jgi:hypothetical protein